MVNFHSPLHFHSLRHFHNLSVLSLGNNPFGDVGIIAIADAVGALSTLRILKLENTTIGNAGMDALVSAVENGSWGPPMQIFMNEKHVNHPRLVGVCHSKGIDLISNILVCSKRKKTEGPI